MNTCKCSWCKGKNCEYSPYYHREEGYDTEIRNTLAFQLEQIFSLNSEIEKLKKKIKRLEKHVSNEASRSSIQ